jgi:NADPH:quinone reductase-like Zn-dependent oxidoreductase
VGDPGSDTRDVADRLGSLFKSLGLAEGEGLLIRGGTTSVGLAAAAIAKNHRAFVAATTRNPGHTELLRSTGVDDVIVDAGSMCSDSKDLDPIDFSLLAQTQSSRGD